MVIDGHFNLPWKERPAEEARLLNPAFCGELISRMIGDFYRDRPEPLNLAATFLILPLLLHKKTCKALPKRASKAFVGWAGDHPKLLAELPRRARHLQPVTREALIFAIRYRLIALYGAGIIPGSKRIGKQTKPPGDSTAEVRRIRTAAHLVGRWFAAQPTQVSVFRGLSVAP